jgi:hypothetical protein
MANPSVLRRRQVDPEPLALIGPALRQAKACAFQHRHNPLLREFVTVFGMNCLAARKFNFKIQRLDPYLLSNQAFEMHLNSRVLRVPTRPVAKELRVEIPAQFARPNLGFQDKKFRFEEGQTSWPVGELFEPVVELFVTRSQRTDRDRGRCRTLNPVPVQKPDLNVALQRKRALYWGDFLLRDSLAGAGLAASRPNAGIFG